MATIQVTNPADIICGLKAAITALEWLVRDVHLILLEMDHGDLNQQLVDGAHTQVAGILSTYIPLLKEYVVCRDIILQGDYHNMDMIQQTTKPPPMRILELECSTNGFTRPSPMCTPELKFPEMRGGILYTRCYCVHRDGLQDDCPLTLCRGQPDCLVKPWPVCPPARYLRLRYPQQYPAVESPSNIGAHCGT